MFNVTITTTSLNEFLDTYSKTHDVLQSISNWKYSDITEFTELLSVYKFSVDFNRNEIVFYFQEYNTDLFVDALSVILLDILESNLILNYEYSIGNV